MLTALHWKSSLFVAAGLLGTNPKKPTLHPYPKTQLEILTRKSNSKIQLENPTQNPNSKFELEIQIEILTRNLGISLSHSLIRSLVSSNFASKSNIINGS